MTVFYKGVGVGTFHHPKDLSANGIQAALPTAPPDVDAMIRHIAGGVILSPYISVTRSYAVAADYALRGGLGVPTPLSPAFVYEISVPDPLPRHVLIYDPVEFISRHVNDPLTIHSYHHDGAPDVLLGVVDPVRHATELLAIPASPPGYNRRSPPRVTESLVAMVNALRDAEALILGPVASGWVRHRHVVY